MNKYLVFPAVAATAWAQTAAQSEAEKALRAQAERYYTLMQEKKFRDAEKLVAEESKEDYYNGRKPDIKGFSIAGVKFEDPTHATITIKAKQLVVAMARAQVFEMPSITYWKLEDGEWRWYTPERLKNMTPFGAMSTTTGTSNSVGREGQAPGGIQSPNLAAIQSQLSADKTSIIFTGKKPIETFTITNSLPGPVDLTIDPHVATIKGLRANVSKLHLEAGEKTVVMLTWTPGIALRDTVALTASPINSVVSVDVTAN